MTRIFLITILIAININFAHAQDELETETLIFWQPDFVFESDDFTGDLSDNEDLEITCELFDFCTRSTFDLVSILDVPREIEKRGDLLEKAYFAPLFEKSSSTSIKENDISGLLKQKVLFDIYELSARFARQQLDKLQSQLGNEYGAVALLFKDVRSQAWKFQKSLKDEYINEVYKEPKEGAYQRWRKYIDELLKSSQKYQTTPEDCYRFIKDRPLDANYVVSERYN